MIGNGPIRLLLVRHGNTFETGQVPVQVGLRSDLPLTAHGVKQAHDFGLHLKREGILPKAIYAGALKRQTEAARIIGAEVHIQDKVHINERALSEIDYGLWEALTAEQIQEKWPQEYAQWNTRAEWAEGIFGGTLEGHLEAIAHWLDTLCKTYNSGDTIVGVTSNGVIRFFYSFVNDEWTDVVEEQRVEDLKVKTGHYCEILIYRDSIKINAWNVAV